MAAAIVWMGDHWPEIGSSKRKITIKIQEVKGKRRGKRSATKLNKQRQKSKRFEKEERKKERKRKKLCDYEGKYYYEEMA